VAVLAFVGLVCGSAGAAEGSGSITRAQANPDGTLGSIAGSATWSGCEHGASGPPGESFPPPAGGCTLQPFVTVGTSACSSEERGWPHSDPSTGLVLAWEGAEVDGAGSASFDRSEVALSGEPGQSACLTLLEIYEERACTPSPGTACPAIVSVVEDPVTLDEAPMSVGGPEAPVLTDCLLPGADGQKLCGTLNPHSSAKVTGHFIVDDDSTCAGGFEVPAGGGEGEAIEVEAEVSGLTPGTEYVYCLVAVNEAGEETSSPKRVFTTPGSPPRTSPSIEGESASQVTATDATLGATIEPGEGRNAFYQFQIFKDPGEFAPDILCPSPPWPGYDACAGTQAPDALPIGSVCGECEIEPAAAAVRLDLADAGVTLAPATTYHYRVMSASAVPGEDTIEWEEPVVSGRDQTFTTAAALAPTILGERVTATDQTTADLAATVDPHSQAITACEVEYGPTTGYGFAQACSWPSAVSSSPVEVTAALSGLAVGSTYHFRIAATSDRGTATGADETFTTRGRGGPDSAGPGSYGGPGLPGPGPSSKKCKAGTTPRGGRCVPRRHGRHRHLRRHRGTHERHVRRQA
jgi:hypothetical protein